MRLELHAKKLINFLAFLILAYVVSVNTARAETYEISIQSILPKSDQRMAVCEKEETCFVTLEFPSRSSQRKKYIDVAAWVRKGELRLQFMADRQYLTTSQSGQNYAAYDVRRLSSTGERLDVYLPDPLNEQEDLRISPVFRVPGKPLATLQIKVGVSK